MSWLVSAKQYIPAVIGEPFGGGYFAGYISHTANGVPTHALIVAPRATGATGTRYTLTTNLAWKTATTTTTGTTSSFDGVANTAAMVAAGIADHPAAQFCKSLNIGGFTDWYLPSWNELDIAYFNLKPTANTNVISGSGNLGVNSYAVPQRNSAWTRSYPAQTLIARFNTTSEALEGDNHWSSTEGSATGAWVYYIGNGGQNIFSKTNLYLVRAFRRITL